MRTLAARPSILRDIPLGEHVVLEASAGTGKTFTLEHLLVELILSGRVGLDEVLVVTFTEKATNELRVRIRAKLHDLLEGRAALPTEEEVRGGDYWTLDEAARAKLAAAIRAFDGTTITTIHAFCQRVLRENAFASGRLFKETQVDGREAFGRALRDAFRRDVACDPERAVWLKAALGSGWSMADVEELLWSCTQARAELQPDFDPAILDAALAAFPSEDAVRNDVVPAFRFAKLNANSQDKVARTLAALAHAVDRGRRERNAPAFLAAKVDVAYLAERLQPLALRPGPASRVREGVLALAGATPPFDAAVAHVLLDPVCKRLANTKREGGLYDFDDMLGLLDAALRGKLGDSLADAMRDRWRYALIDEFQDTDETQWAIFRNAFFVPGARRSVVALIGDPKQSIYRFRGADVDTYLKAREDVVASGGTRVVLDRNFRATPALVDACNALFDSQDEDAPFFTGRMTYEPVACGRPDRSLVDGSGNPVTPVHALRFERDVPLSVLGAVIAREIRLITDPARPWRLGDSPVAHEDIYVLTRTRGEGRTVSVALRAAGIPFAFYKEDGLFQTNEAKEIRSLLFAIDDPDDRARRVAAWLTPFFALPLGEVERARDLPSSHPYVSRLHEWRALAQARDFEALFASLVRDSGVVRRAIFFSDGERELTNYLHVLELLLEYAMNAHATLRDVVFALSGLIDRTRTMLDIEGNVQRLESERRAVQIMTVHKAKGLEAAVVFVAGGTSRVPEDRVRLYHEQGHRLAWVGSLQPRIKTLVTEEEREEEQRLMYVALTRAKGRLYLPSVVNGDKPVKLRGAYEAVNRRVFYLLAAKTPGFSVEDVQRAPLAPGGASNDEVAPIWKPPVSLLREDRPPTDYAVLRSKHAGTLVTSYTRMKQRAPAPASWTQDDDERATEHAEDSIDDGPLLLRAARSSGIFLHEVLERVPLDSFEGTTFDTWRARADVGRLFGEAIVIHRIEREQREHAERLVWAAYTTPLTLPTGRAIAGLWSAPRVVREMDFVFPVDGDHHVYVRGSLDFVFEHEGVTYFTDWKTDSLGSFESTALARHVDAHYAEQVELYALAVLKLLGIADREDYEARFGGVLYCFLRGLDHERGVWAYRPSWDEIVAWAEALRNRGTWTRRGA